MGYVALSRVKSLDTLTLGGLNRTALTMHEEAYELDEQLRSKSAKDNKRLGHLEAPYLENAAKRNKKHETRKTSGSVSWQAKLEKMRADYPNAYKPWKEIEDKTLLNAWADGKKIKELSKKLGRHEGSVRARLKKHFGDDIFS